MGNIPSIFRGQFSRDGLFIIALVLAVLSVTIWTQLERRFIFFPAAEIEYTPDEVGLVYEEVYFNNAEGLRLHGWYVPGPSDVTWLWFHGNGGNIGHRVDEIALIHSRLGVNLLIFDYQGYGKSEGDPSEQGTYVDARAALEYLRSRPDLSPEKIVYFGRSLGAAVAIELATAQEPLGLVLVAPFASLSDMARLHYPYLPAHLLVGNRYNSIQKIPDVRAPLLIIHGDQDEIVPLSQGQKLFDAAGEPKQFLVLPGAGHNDTYVSGGATYWKVLTQFTDVIGTGTSSPHPD